MIPTPGKLRRKIGILEAGNNVVDFGEIFRGKVFRESVSLYNPGEEPVELGIIKNYNFFKITFQPQVLLPDQSGELLLELNTENCNFGDLLITLEINLKTAAEQTYGKITVAANIQEDFSILTDWEKNNPPQISLKNSKIELGDIEIDSEKTYNLNIANKGKRDLIIHNISSSNSLYSISPLKCSIPPEADKDIKLSVTPTNNRSNVNSKLTIISNDPNNSVFKLNIRGKTLKSSDSLGYFVQDITVQDVRDLIQRKSKDNNFKILDVRTTEEYTAGHIKNAIHIDYYDPDFNDKLEALNKNNIYLVYCKSGYRSGKSVSIMKSIGFNHIYHMPDGFDGWTKQ